MNENLPYMTNEGRLEAYNLVLQGCTHLWSKGKLQRDRVLPVLGQLVLLAKNDPIFTAHLTAYVHNQGLSKDLRIMTAFANSLSVADGSPFDDDPEIRKPNLRYVSHSVIQNYDPKMMFRVAQLGRSKFEVPDVLRYAYHYPRSMQEAVKKYVTYREANPDIVKGIKKAGLTQVYLRLYKLIHMKPSDRIESILNGDIFKQFAGLSELEVAEKIRSEKISALTIPALVEQITPIIAVAILEVATPNQAVILTETFERAGVLEDEEVKKLYAKKIRQAETALDRAETVGKQASQEVQKILEVARSERRKEQVGDFGKIFVHMDISGSMTGPIELAKKNGAIISEMVNNPEENFAWGWFNHTGRSLQTPRKFTAAGFQEVLFGIVPGGGTNGYALYPQARDFGADTDVFISDGDVDGSLGSNIKSYHESHPSQRKPRVMIWIKVSGWRLRDTLKKAYEANGIPVAEITPTALSSSARVAQSVREALQGPMAVIDAIMETKLPDLPKWWATI